MKELTLEVLKVQWNQILDELLKRDRIAWLAFFDARLDSLLQDTLTLDFRDSDKFGGKHDYKSSRSVSQFEALSKVIFEITGCNIEIVEKVMPLS